MALRRRTCASPRLVAAPYETVTKLSAGDDDSRGCCRGNGAPRDDLTPDGRNANIVTKNAWTRLTSSPILIPKYHFEIEVSFCFKA